MLKGTVEIKGTSSDPDGDKITEIGIYLNDKTITKLTTGDLSSWSYNWDTKGHQNGEYKLNIMAVDEKMSAAVKAGATGIVAEVKTIEIKIENK